MHTAWCGVTFSDPPSSLRRPTAPSRRSPGRRDTGRRFTFASSLDRRKQLCLYRISDTSPPQPTNKSPKPAICLAFLWVRRIRWRHKTPCGPTADLPAGSARGPQDGAVRAMPKLTDAFLRTFRPAPGAKDRLAFDTDCRGLGVRATAGGSRVFLVQWADAATGRKQREPLGAWGGITLAQARAAARARLGRVAQGINPATERANAKAEDQRQRACCCGGEGGSPLHAGRADRRLGEIAPCRQAGTICRRGRASVAGGIRSTSGAAGIGVDPCRGDGGSRQAGQ